MGEREGGHGMARHGTHAGFPENARRSRENGGGKARRRTGRTNARAARPRGCVFFVAPSSHSPFLSSVRVSARSELDVI